jgi:hypothetical protein
LPGQRALQRPKQIKVRGRQVRGLWRMIDWTDSEFL